MKFEKLAQGGTLMLLGWLALTGHNNAKNITEIKAHTFYQTEALKKQSVELSARAVWMRDMENFKGFVLSKLEERDYKK